jgi:predicted nucleotidyltransferase
MQPINLKIYNNKLDPLLWDSNGNLNPRINNLLLKIANDFYVSTKLKAKIVDVVLLGSSAAYNYTPTSDIDIHVIIDFKELDMPHDDAMEYTNSLKSNWNSKHNVHIRQKKIELYKKKEVATRS